MTATSTPHLASDASVPLLVGEHWIETLNDGSHVLVRPIRTEDRERESEFIERLSPESRHFRFLGEMREASPALLDQLVNIDRQKDMAFVALVHDTGVLREVGVSRYSTAGGDNQCECAVTVADDWQHRGLGVVLMRHLIDVARRNGFRRMFSMDAASNEPMRDLASYLGFERKRDPQDAAQVIHSLDL